MLASASGNRYLELFSPAVVPKHLCEDSWRSRSSWQAHPAMVSASGNRYLELFGPAAGENILRRIAMVARTFREPADVSASHPASAAVHSLRAGRGRQRSTAARSRPGKRYDHAPALISASGNRSCRQAHLAINILNYLARGCFKHLARELELSGLWKFQTCGMR